MRLTARKTGGERHLWGVRQPRGTPTSRLARKTNRLEEAPLAIVVELGGRAGARLAVTWELFGGTSDLTLTLSPGADGGADFELEHVAVLPFTEEQYLGGIGGMAPGWEDALAGLEMRRRGDPAGTPAAGWYGPGSEEEVGRRWNALGRVWRDLARATFAKA